MKKRTKEQMKAYQAGRRARLALKAAAATAAPAPVGDLTHTENDFPTPENRQMSPENSFPAPESPAPTLPALPPEPCPDCAILRDELTKERDESARLRDMIKVFLTTEKQNGEDLARLKARLEALERSTQAAHSSAPSPDVPIETRQPVPREEDAQALAKRVIEQKVNRINNFGANRCIGRV